jgi:hypothetical protein
VVDFSSLWETPGEHFGDLCRVDVFILRVSEALNQNAFKCWSLRYNCSCIPPGLAELLETLASLGFDFLKGAKLCKNPEETVRKMFYLQCCFGFGVEMHGFNENE